MSAETKIDPRELRDVAAPATPITDPLGHTLDYTGDFRKDVGRVVSELDHYCEDTHGCDIARAIEDGYPFWAASLLMGATDCDATHELVNHYCDHGADFGACANLDCDEWLQTDTWTRYAVKCQSCGSICFDDSGYTLDACTNCLSSDIVPLGADGYDVDEFVNGYLDAILFTESAQVEERLAELQVEISEARRLGRDPQRQLCAVADLQDFSTDCSLLSYGAQRSDFTAEAVAELRVECLEFIAANRKDLDRYAELRGDRVRCNVDSFGRTEYSAAEYAGSDFWLSRNGHGAGYFYHGDDSAFNRLQDAARVYGEAYVSFDGDEISV